MGYVNVYRYLNGKVEWLSNGLPAEGKLASELQIGAIAHPDVATCRLDQQLGEVEPDHDLCVVVNEQCIVLGDLRGKSLRGEPRTPVEQVMDPAPSTYRPNVRVKQMAHHMLESGARKVLVADADGRLVGWLSFEDVLRALDQQSHEHDGHA